jgi:hypothetical protein
MLTLPSGTWLEESDDRGGEYQVAQLLGADDADGPGDGLDLVGEGVEAAVGNLEYLDREGSILFDDACHGVEGGCGVVYRFLNPVVDVREGCQLQVFLDQISSNLRRHEGPFREISNTKCV